jgi:dCTP deaminase
MRRNWQNTPVIILPQLTRPERDLRCRDGQFAAEIWDVQLECRKSALAAFARSLPPSCICYSFVEMSFWSTQRIRAEQERLGNLVEPFSNLRINQGAYELALSREVITSPHTGGRSLPGEGQVLEIPPGQFALLYTEEKVSIPAHLIAFISIKATVKLDGLVNISGFHVDPGFTGRLKFSVYNAGNLPIFLEYGRETFLIWFSELDAATEDPYDGNHKNQNRITPHDRQRMSEESHSPAALDRRLEKVEQKITWVFAAAAMILAGIIFPRLASWIGEQNSSKSPPSQIAAPASSPVPNSTQAAPPSPTPPKP